MRCASIASAPVAAGTSAATVLPVFTSRTSRAAICAAGGAVPTALPRSALLSSVSWPIVAAPRVALPNRSMPL